jgi:hypothetical protein
LNLRASDSGALLTLFNASDEEQIASISSGLIRIDSAYRCDLFGNKLEPLTVNNDAVEVTIAPRQTMTLLLN